MLVNACSELFCNRSVKRPKKENLFMGQKNGVIYIFELVIHKKYIL